MGSSTSPSLRHFPKKVIMATMRVFCLWIISIFLTISTVLGFSASRVESQEEDVWQNSLEENRGMGYFEGDIIPSLNRNADPSSSKVWKNGIIPYKISDEYFFFYKNKIRSAMTDLENKVKVGDKDCIKFVPHEGTKGDYLDIVKGSGCSSYVGCQHWGSQQVNLAAGIVETCMRQGIIQHELMHALGFYHEQSRSDRDEYVIINKENVQEGMLYNFHKYSYTKNQGQPYDYGSLMHYGSTEFGKWGILGPKTTITTKKKGVKIGQRNGPSPIDINEIRLLYNCL